mgnify:CR=1 FL=1
MHYINGIYTTPINGKRSGDLFQGRYKTILIDRDSYLLDWTSFWTQLFWWVDGVSEVLSGRQNEQAAKEISYGT